MTVRRVKPRAERATPCAMKTTWSSYAVTQYLMDRTAILDCISSHSRGHDRHDAELLTNAYHPDGFDEHGKAVNPGPAYAA